MLFIAMISFEYEVAGSKSVTIEFCDAYVNVVSAVAPEAPPAVSAAHSAVTATSAATEANLRFMPFLLGRLQP